MAIPLRIEVVEHFCRRRAGAKDIELRSHHRYWIAAPHIEIRSAIAGVVLPIDDCAAERRIVDMEVSQMVRRATFNISKGPNQSEFRGVINPVIDLVAVGGVPEILVEGTTIAVADRHDVTALVEQGGIMTLVVGRPEIEADGMPVATRLIVVNVILPIVIEEVICLGVGAAA